VSSYLIESIWRCPRRILQADSCNASFGNLRIFCRFHPTHTHRADAVTVFDDGHTALQHTLQVRRAQEGGTTTVDHVFVDLAFAAAHRRGARFAGRYVRGNRSSAIQTLEPQHVAAVVNNADAHSPVVFEGFGLSASGRVLGLLDRALGLLAVKKTERVIDWFCGLGNFTLPLATQAREVLGVEGAESLVARSRENYALNRLPAHGGKALAATEFVARNLFEMTPALLVADAAADKWLVDPPREGAFSLVQALAALHQQPELRGDWTPPRRIVYVSCNPATLARDAGVLVQEAGYRCSKAGVVNMFPHTAHVESIAVFDLVA
jgi:hypothetical protein